MPELAILLLFDEMMKIEYWPIGVLNMQRLSRGSPEILDKILHPIPQKEEQERGKD